MTSEQQYHLKPGHTFRGEYTISVNIILTNPVKVQLDATVCSLIYFTAESLYMFRVSQHPSSGVLKPVTAASGTGLNIGTATSFQRGHVGAK